MDQQAASLLSLLKRTGAPSEAKLNQLNALKSDIKHYRVPESAQATIFECLRIAITQSASSTIATSAFSTLGHLFKRLKIQDATGHSIIQLAPRMLVPLQERLGDLREPHRQAASQCLSDLYPFLQSDVEHIIREEAIPGGNPRAKEAAMRWVARMHAEEGMAFKSYVGPIVANLEDSDPTAREAAKATLIELFREAPERAKADLKKQLKAYSVRLSIESQILAHLGASSSLSGSTSRQHVSASPAPDADLTTSTRSLPAFDHTAHFTETINSEAAKPPPQEEVPMDPIYIHTQRELDDTFRDMIPFFQGREEEGNWVQRDKSVLKLRRILKGNAPSEFHAFFMAELKGLMEGILKVANSLRTTVSSNGCLLVQELVRTLGPAIDHHVEILLQNFIRMSAVTKPIAANNGKVTVEAIFQHVSYNVRLMQHVWSAAQDKNPQTRQYSTTWLQTMLKRQAGYKSQFEHSGGLDLAMKCIEKGLNDANPKVKEAIRATYWTFAKDWPKQADSIMAKLDPKSKSLLEKDANNPNAALHGSIAASASSSRSAAGSRAALREQIAAQRKAKMTHKLPERPNSAMADLSPVKQRTTPAGSTQRAGPSKLRNDTRAPSTTATASSSSTVSTASSSKPGSSLMSGPVRRPRRQEPVRPQTADPYASRRMLTRPETPANETPAHSPLKGTGASKTSTASTAASRNRAQTSSSARSQTGSPVKTRSPVVSRIPHSSPRPVSRGSQAGHSDETSLSHVTDDFTMVMPKQTTAGRAGERGAAQLKRLPLEQAASADIGMHGMEEDDNFTMVMPSMNRNEPRVLSPPANGGSPLKQMFAEARRLASDEMTRPGSSWSQRERSGTPMENGYTTPRRGSPTKSVTPQPVQIYEDPFTAEANHNDEVNARQVLGELPINGNASGVQSPTQSNDSSNSPAGSPIRNTTQARSPNPPSTQDRAEVLRNKRLLASGIERIRSKTLDAHGFRRVQDLTKSPLDIWDGGKAYNDLLEALLEYLQTFDSDPKLLQQPSSKSLGLKAQALGLLRGLMALHRKYGVAWQGRVLIALIMARQGIDHNSHLLADLEKVSDEIVKVASSHEACIEAILEQPLLQPIGLATSVEKEEPDKIANPARPVRSIAMGLLTMRNLLVAASVKAQSKGDNDDVTFLDSTLRSRLAATISRCLEDPDADVRKADVELASELFECVGEDKASFWNEFKDVDEGRLGLLAYYTARRGRGSVEQ